MDSNEETTEITEKQEVRLARKVTWIGFGVNALLAVLKIIAGIVGRSSAMIADGFHSMSDFLTDVIVLVFVGVARRKANRHYQYGHGKYETFATMLVSFALGIVGIFFFVEGIEAVWKALEGEQPDRPGTIALVMAIVSILSKEWLYHYTVRIGRKISSSVIIANAWHHRSDSLSSLATLAGIAGAMFLGEKWRILDPLAAMLVSIFILVVAVKLARPAIRELLDGALPEEIISRLHKIIGSTPGVKAFHRLRTRRNGNKTILEVHLKVDPEMTVEESHNIATTVENRLKSEFNGNAIVTTHVEPYHNEIIDDDKLCMDKR